MFQNKDDYNGEWAFDLRNGKGIMRYADGRQFDRTWKDNAVRLFPVVIFLLIVVSTTDLECILMDLVNMKEIG